ncbi:hypothetical protein [Acidisoma silvae]|uniref:Uncharacterized protein n=1 Tax=Acidisoma silvae TaxID=2802396 RepID=A0A963YVH5_9PROT|nr:hypothetical protein [Acidisoma silvae]MCB8877864.1 hypothetical protein [Acidisoma silvae]
MRRTTSASNAMPGRPSRIAIKVFLLTSRLGVPWSAGSMPISETVPIWFIGQSFTNAIAGAVAGMTSVARDSANGAFRERGSRWPNGFSVSGDEITACFAAFPSTRDGSAARFLR